MPKKTAVKPSGRTLETVLPYILSVGGAIGFLAAFVLSTEKVALLKDPGFIPSCNLSPILSCGSVMNTHQAEAFGFLNSFLGIAGFAIVTTVGMALLAGATLKRWFWRGLQLGTLFGVGFVTWLQFQSIFRINALCPYCMVVWSVTIPIFWYTLLYNIRQGHLPFNKKAAAFLQRYHGDILLAWFLIILGIIIKHFWYYWQTLI
jgi:uncharacterized membrane protein